MSYVTLLSDHWYCIVTTSITYCPAGPGWFGQTIVRDSFLYQSIVFEVFVVFLSAFIVFVFVFVIVFVVASPARRLVGFDKLLSEIGFLTN